MTRKALVIAVRKGKFKTGDVVQVFKLDETPYFAKIEGIVSNEKDGIHRVLVGRPLQIMQR